MRYLGGKVRQARRIIDTVKMCADAYGRTRYIEPFVGGGSVLAEASRVFEAPEGADAEPLVAALWAAGLSGWVPPDEVSREMYDNLRRTGEVSPLAAWCAFAVSYNGKRWACYGPTAAGRNYVAESRRAFVDKVARIKAADGRVVLRDYQDTPIGNDVIVFCDPPYADTTGYGADFDTPAFWRWANATSERAPVLVSEYAAPDGWVVADEWSRGTSWYTKTRKRTEILVVHPRWT